MLNDMSGDSLVNIMTLCFTLIIIQIAFADFFSNCKVCSMHTLFYFIEVTIVGAVQFCKNIY